MRKPYREQEIFEVVAGHLDVSYLIERISELDSSIGSVLEGLAAELDYDRLLSPLESGKAGVGDIS